MAGAADSGAALVQDGGVSLGQRLLGSARALRDRQQLVPFSRENPELAALIRDVRREGLTFLSARALSELAEAVIDIDNTGIAGDVVETGAALGGSSVILGRAKSPARTLRVYDTFGMIPPPTDRDGDDVRARFSVIEAGEAKGIGGSTYYGYRADLLTEVRESFSRHGVDVDAEKVQLIQGLYSDTLHISQPVALAHIDCDWYDSVTTCLERIAPHMVVGARFVIDDYYHWSSAREAVDEFFANRPEFQRVERSRLHLVRTR